MPTFIKLFQNSHEILVQTRKLSIGITSKCVQNVHNEGIQTLFSALLNMTMVIDAQADINSYLKYGKYTLKRVINTNIDQVYEKLWHKIEKSCLMKMGN